MRKRTKRPQQRQLAVIESLPGISLEATSQLIWASIAELEMYKKAFPYLSVRWAEAEDKAKWRFSHQIFERNPEEQLW